MGSINELLEASLNEKDVENAYRQELLSLFKGSSITSPYGGDGLLEYVKEKGPNLRLLLEFKYEEDLKKKINQCNVLIQCLYYIKRYENAGEKLPTVLFVGDKNECFALHTNSVVKYLSKEIDWNIAPSSAAVKNPTMVRAMVDDQDIAPFVFNVDHEFNASEVINKIKDLNDNVVRLVRATPQNINPIFDYFYENVFDHKNNELTANEVANLFIQLLINPADNYLHPTKKNRLITETQGEIRVNSHLFNSFFKHFESNYSPKEKEQLTAMVDRLVEDSSEKC